MSFPILLSQKLSDSPPKTWSANFVPGLLCVSGFSCGCSLRCENCSGEWWRTFLGCWYWLLDVWLFLFKQTAVVLLIHGCSRREVWLYSWMQPRVALKLSIAALTWALFFRRGLSGSQSFRRTCFSGYWLHFSCMHLYILFLVVPTLFSRWTPVGCQKATLSGWVSVAMGAQPVLCHWTGK